MKKIKYTLIPLILFYIATLPLKAQENDIPKTIQVFDLAIGAGDGIYSGALSWNRTHGLFDKKKLRLGYGLRLSGFSGSNLTYTSAPANLAADESTVDTLIVHSPLTMGLSASIHIEYLFTPKLKAGFNIDALGLGFGSESVSTLISSENNNGNHPVSLSAKPTPLNLLLGGANDNGQLKSEFFVGYAISNKLWIRGGMDMTFSEYTTEVKLTNNNDRFRYTAMMFFAGVSFNPFAGNE